jgi:hypothetical protein
MELAFLAAFAMCCAVCALRPPLAFALVVLMFPMEQVIQAHAPGLISSAFGIKAVNYGVGVTAVFAAAKACLTRPKGFSRWMNTATVSALSLLAWAAVSLLWSPGRAEGLEVVVGNIPYLVLFIIVAPLLVGDIDDLRMSQQAVMVIGMVLCAIIVVSPEFTSRFGRLGYVVASGVRSNPLAIGELGGVVLLVGATMRGSTLLGFPLLPLRVAAAILGVLVAIKSGSRGQLAFALMVTILFVPVAAPVRNVGAFISSAIIVGLTVVVVDFVISTQLQGIEARRFSGEALLYGDSSAFGRVNNVIALGSEWIRNPLAILIGLGYYAFSSLSASGGQPYSHVMFADALFELGIPGVVLTATGLIVSGLSVLRLFRAFGSDRVLRATVAVMGGMLAYQVLLANKQGTMWGIPMLFMLQAVVTRIWLRERDAMEEQSLVAEEDEEAHDGYAVAS